MKMGLHIRTCLGVADNRFLHALGISLDCLDSLEDMEVLWSSLDVDQLLSMYFSKLAFSFGTPFTAIHTSFHPACILAKRCPLSTAGTDHDTVTDVPISLITAGLVRGILASGTLYPSPPDQSDMVAMVCCLTPS